MTRVLRFPAPDVPKTPEPMPDYLPCAAGCGALVSSLGAICIACTLGGL